MFNVKNSEAKREERKVRKRQQNDDMNAILCNSVKMIREKLTVSEGRFDCIYIVHLKSPQITGLMLKFVGLLLQLEF